MRRHAPVISGLCSEDARGLLAEQKRLIEEIDRFLEEHDTLSSSAERGLLEIEKKLLRNAVCARS